MLRGRSAKGPPDDASVEKIVQQVQYETVIDRISWIRHFTLFLMIMYIFLESFCSTGMVGVVRARPLTAVELYLSCACANTDDSASNPLPSIPSGLEKEQLDKAIEGEFSKLAHQSWRGDNMEIKPLEGKQLFASINANGQVLADHAKVGNSLWSKLHDLNISLAAIQDTRLQDPDKQTAAERQARMLADGHQMAYSWSNAPH